MINIFDRIYLAVNVEGRQALRSTKGSIYVLNEFNEFDILPRLYKINIDTHLLVIICHIKFFVYKCHKHPTDISSI